MSNAPFKRIVPLNVRVASAPRSKLFGEKAVFAVILMYGKMICFHLEMLTIYDNKCYVIKTVRLTR